ncbi:activating transcription factor 7-interacting protein 1 isoform X2 [Fopius arisanus]|uniref:Activating transcription factor 7-interacting protein 1 isoform X2 n=1 Tax=Fopius arisanus TaxID=64838 RepID=A0A9R1U7C9_9HYME|nr:PREDICTED: activating transcription factor 7-interacting protein 1 isoform X2 [Fopius arisanus]
MMESVKAQSMPITETKQLCTTPEENGLEEISTQLENELLYGGGDDGETLSDDALSEDSYRLRVSDDDNVEDKIETSKTVKNNGDSVDKTELTESTPDVLETNGKLQLDIINGDKGDMREKNAEDFTDDFHVDQDNFSKDEFDVSLDKYSDSKTGKYSESSTSQTKKIISVKSLDELSDISSDSDNQDYDEPKHNDKVEELETPRITPVLKDSESDSLELDLNDKTDDNVNETIDSETVPAPPNAESNCAIPEDNIEDDDNDILMNEEVEKNSKSESTEKDIRQIDNSDAGPLPDESGGTASKSQPPVDPEEPKNKSRGHDIAPDKEKNKTGAIPASSECRNTVSGTDIKTAQSSSKKNDDQTGSKRRLSSSETDNTPKKISCIDTEKLQATEKSKTSEKSLEVPEKSGENEKIEAHHAILKSLLAPCKKSKSTDEIIDIDDDNTIDSMSSGVSVSVNDNPPVTESVTEKAKPNSEVKETISENLDDSRTRKKRRLRGDSQLMPAKDVITRAKREAAQKAELTVRKNIVTLNNDSDSDSEDSSSMVPYTPKQRATSPSSLKRNMESDERVDLSISKKLKTDNENDNAQTNANTKAEAKKTFNSVRKFFLRDNKKRLKKLTQEELEELFIQKIVETITMREEIGRLREKAKISERNQEATRLKCQQLSKQINDFEMVLNRFSADRRNSILHTPTPIKINRSVGLQVNFLTDIGVQNLRQLQAAGKGVHPKVTPKSTINGMTPPQAEDINARRGIKIRSPRRTDVPVVAPVGAPVHTALQAQPLISTVTPSSISLSKPVDTRTTASTGQPIHHVVINGVTNSITRTTKVLTPNKTNPNALIDLTGEEEKKNSLPPPLTAIITTTAGPNHVTKVQGRYQRVISTTGITLPQNAIRVVQPAGQPTPTALVNNMSNVGGAPRFVVMQPGRQIVVANNNNQIRATAGNTRAPISNITYTSVPTISNGTVRVVPTSGTTVQLYKHPAPLPDSVTYKHDPSLKLPPPAPSLKISKVQHGIVLSWNMPLSEKYADIASYQLYAYQEIAGIAPNSSNWKKVGDVRALPLPMACTLTQFSEGNNYYFAVRAVDTHSRYGQYSQPGNISL